jgi:quercetin dioxygenase-like cupin family protein
MNAVVRVVVKALAIVTFVTLVLAAIVAGVRAQQAGFKRTVLQQGNLSVPGHEVVQAIAEFQPGATVGRHTHPGEEIGYVLEGTILLEQEGKPNVTLGAGKTFLIPPGTVHNATNSGSSRARVLATYIVEKGKPLATPVAGK